MRHIVVDADGEMVLRRRLCASSSKTAFHHRRREFFRRQAVSPADHPRHDCHAPPLVGLDSLSAVTTSMIQRLARGCRVPWCDPARRWLRTVLGSAATKCFTEKRPKKPHFQHADLFALRAVRYSTVSCAALCARSHHHNHALGIGSADIIEEAIMAPRDPLRKSVHRALDDCRARQVEWIDRLARLKITRPGSAPCRAARDDRATAPVRDAAGPASSSIMARRSSSSSTARSCRLRARCGSRQRNAGTECATRSVAACAISAKSMASCTEFEHSMAKPVARAAITSLWSPKIDSACAASERAAT